MKVRRYCAPDGTDCFGSWIASLADTRARAAVLVRIARLAAGNFGDCKTVGGGILELRIDHGPGYRVYFARIGIAVVLLLGGGDKRRQRQDIRLASERLKDYRRRSSE